MSEKNNPMKKKSSQRGLPEGWTRATFILQEKQLKKIKDLAYWKRTTVKEIVNEALTLFLKNKKIKAQPDIE